MKAFKVSEFGVDAAIDRGQSTTIPRCFLSHHSRIGVSLKRGCFCFDRLNFNPKIKDTPTMCASFVLLAQLYLD